MAIGTDEQWQKLIDKYGINKAGEMLMFILEHPEELKKMVEPNQPEQE